MNNNITLTLTNTEVSKVRLAITNIIQDMRTELNSEETTQDRKDILNGSIEMWNTLRNKIIEQSK